MDADTDAQSGASPPGSLSKRSDSGEPLSRRARRSEASVAGGRQRGSPGAPRRLAAAERGLSRICQFLLLPAPDRCGRHSALNLGTGERFVCKVFGMAHYQQKLRIHSILPPHRNISQIKDIILGDRKAYVFFDQDYGDMRAFLRRRQWLSEGRAARLFHQVASVAAHCHQAGVVLCALSLRKFVFSDENRTHLRLASLEDAHVLEEDSDFMSDKHGCPAYVSPEILDRCSSYSGKRADVWSLGVILYTLLVGRYPFSDVDRTALYSKIRQGKYCLPDSLSPGARCLLNGLLQREPQDRLTAAEVLLHPWFQGIQEAGSAEQEVSSPDQTVPTFRPEPVETHSS